MAHELYVILYGNVHVVSGDIFQTAHQGEESFLREIITPIYQVMRKEARRNKGGTAAHSKWRNYDDLNEYFWSDKCFKLGWPMDPGADFFVRSDEILPINEPPNQVTVGKRKPKTNFVELRTFWHFLEALIGCGYSLHWLSSQNYMWEEECMRICSHFSNILYFDPVADEQVGIQLLR